MEDFVHSTVGNARCGCIVIARFCKYPCLASDPKIRVSIRSQDDKYHHKIELIARSGQVVRTKEVATDTPFGFVELDPTLPKILIKEPFSILTVQQNTHLISSGDQSYFCSVYNDEQIIVKDQSILKIIAYPNFVQENLNGEDGPAYGCANIIDIDLSMQVVSADWTKKIFSCVNFSEEEKEALASEYKTSCTMFIKYYPLLIPPLENHLDRLQPNDRRPTIREDFAQLLSVLKNLYEIVRRDKFTLEEVGQALMSKERFHQLHQLLFLGLTEIINDEEANSMRDRINPLVQECKTIAANAVESTKNNPLYSIYKELQLKINSWKVIARSLDCSLEEEFKTYSFLSKSTLESLLETDLEVNTSTLCKWRNFLIFADRSSQLWYTSKGSNNPKKMDISSLKTEDTEVEYKNFNIAKMRASKNYLFFEFNEMIMDKTTTTLYRMDLTSLENGKPFLFEKMVSTKSDESIYKFKVSDTFCAVYRFRDESRAQRLDTFLVSSPVDTMKTIRLADLWGNIQEFNDGENNLIGETSILGEQDFLFTDLNVFGSTVILDSNILSNPTRNSQSWYLAS